MSAYPLVMLIGVCKLREDAAASAMRAAELKLHNEEEEEKRLCGELAEYHQWRIAEEDKRYDAVIGTDTDKAGMEEFRAGLASLKEREIQYEGAIIESKQRQIALREALEQTKKTYHLAVLESRKIDAHRVNWLEEWNREQVRLEDVEMEEFSGKQPSNPHEEESVDVEDDYGG